MLPNVQFILHFQFHFQQSVDRHSNQYSEALKGVDLIFWFSMQGACVKLACGPMI